MAKTVYNQRKQAKYPQKFNQRENKASTSNFSLLEANENAALAADDAISFVRMDATAGARTLTLSPAKESAGRCITVMKTDASANTVTISDPTSSVEGPGDLSLDQAGEWAEIFCTGAAWKVVKHALASI